MAFEDRSPRAALPVGLLALFPLTWYALGSSLTAGIVSAVNVVLILSCLYVAFGPVDAHDDHESNGTSV